MAVTGERSREGRRHIPGWRDGGEKPIFHFAIPLTVPRDSEREREREERERYKGEREGKGGSASADYLSTSVINVESRIVLGLCVRVHACMCVFERLMTQANRIRVPPEIGSDCHNFLPACPHTFTTAVCLGVCSPHLSVHRFPPLSVCVYTSFSFLYLITRLSLSLCVSCLCRSCWSHWSPRLCVLYELSTTDKLMLYSGADALLLMALIRSVT